MPTYQVTTDSGTYQIDTQAPGEQQQAPQGASKLNASDQATNVIGQLGKGVYENPLVHPALKALSDITNSGAEQTYANLPQPQGITQKVASGIGSALPVVATATPMMDAAGAILGATAGATKAIPVIGKLTSLLKDSTIAKSAMTGYGYGQAENMAMQAQGQQIDPNHPVETAKQFMVWGALSKGGATLAGKLLPKSLPMQEQFAAKMPGSLKQAYTPEGLGTIAGGALAGSIQSPDQQSGIAGAIVGGALSAFNPQEQIMFKQGLGKGMGYSGISALTDHWGSSFYNANNVFEDKGFDAVQKAGTYQNQQGENTLHEAAKSQIDGYNERYKDLHDQTNPVLQDMDNNIGSQGTDDSVALVNRMQALINNKFRTPGMVNGVKRAFNDAYPNLQAIELPTGLAKQYGIAPDDYEGKTFRTSLSDLQKITDPQLQQRMLSQLREHQISSNPQAMRSMATGFGNGAIRATAPLTDISYPALDELRQTMSKLSQKGDPQESGTAAQLAKMISDHIKERSDKAGGEYTKLMTDWTDLFKTGSEIGETDDYRKLAQKLSNPHWGNNETATINNQNRLKAIDSFFLDLAKEKGNEKYGKYATKDSIDAYHAWQVYANPTVEGLAKNFPIRTAASVATAGAFGMMGLGGIGAPLGGMIGWHLGSPEAWIPMLKGAEMARLRK